jgi:hypothetical protein
MSKTPHKHAAVIKAWADGAEIQGLIGDKWVNVGLGTMAPAFNVCDSYRIKPEPVKVKYRNWLYAASHNGPFFVTTWSGSCSDSKIAVEERISFLRWIGEEQEIEVEVE